jgi:GntR family transcriptional repressor for pyruvate dehydrogenase complex
VVHAGEVRAQQQIVEPPAPRAKTRCPFFAAAALLRVHYLLCVSDPMMPRSGPYTPETMEHGMVEIKKKRASVARFKPVKGTRPADEISTQIRERIAKRSLQVGDRLPSERELSDQFQVSRNSVRQALHSLADSGLLEMRKGAAGGAFVIDGGSDAVLSAFTDLFNLGAIRPADLTEVRVLVGVEAARLACLRATAAEIDELEANVVQAEAAVRAGDHRHRREINLEFHRKLARMSHNPILVTLTGVVTALTLQFVEKLSPTPVRSVMPLRRQMLKHLRERDAEGAASAMRTHLLRMQQIYLQQT